MSAWLPLNLIGSSRTFTINFHSIDEIVVRERKVLLIRNRSNFLWLVVISFNCPKRFLLIPLYHRSEHFP